jgi:hypothetical protein
MDLPTGFDESSRRAIGANDVERFVWILGMVRAIGHRSGPRDVSPSRAIVG